MAHRSGCARSKPACRPESNAMRFLKACAPSSGCRRSTGSDCSCCSARSFNSPIWRASMPRSSVCSTSIIKSFWPPTGALLMRVWHPATPSDSGRAGVQDFGFAWSHAPLAANTDLILRSVAAGRPSPVAVLRDGRASAASSGQGREGPGLSTLVQQLCVRMRSAKSSGARAECVSSLLYFASGSGRSWTCMASGLVLFPPSLSQGVRSPLVVHNPRPFQPALGSSMRPSRPLA